MRYPKTERIQISLPPELVAEMRDHAALYGLTLSGMMSVAAREFSRARGDAAARCQLGVKVAQRLKAFMDAKHVAGSRPSKDVEAMIALNDDAELFAEVESMLLGRL